MKSTTNFLGGLDADRNQLVNKPNTYTNALNVDIILDEINGSIVLTNSKGNKLQSTIPTSFPIHNWSVIKINANNTITINNVSTIFPSTTGSTNFDLYTFIITNYASLITSNLISVFYDDNRVVIVEKSALLLTTVSGTGLRINSNLEIPLTTIQKPIGYGIINREIYIFTTSCDDIDPKTTGNGYGFIWRFSYDTESFDPLSASFQLIYAANLNWSTYWNFPQTGIVTRYETDAIRKIWFTDFYNPLRSINVADPNVMTQNPEILSISPNVLIYKPIFVSLLDGGTNALHSGVYQSYYKLTKNLSKDSVNSEISNLVSVGATAMSSSFQGYVGDTSSTPKIITWQVDNIDINFDNIEFYVVIRETDDFGVNRRSVRVDTKSINNQSSITFSVDQSAIVNGIIITDSQASVQQYNGFTHCKTIAEKDNLLIAANLKNELVNTLDNFDARAFRSFSPNSQDIRLTNNNINSSYTLAAASALPQTSDCINDYTSGNACYYKPNTNVLGGAGPNVSYTFITEQINVDGGVTNSAAFAPWFIAYPENVSQNLLVKSPIDYQRYSNGNGSTFYSTYKNPQYSGLLKGYMRGEVYRFGIQFFTKSMQPLFVKWIGDIKFPDHFQSNPTSPSGDFRTLTLTTSSTGALQAQTRTLGILFSISGLDQISDSIGGYSIVRVQRKYADRTIINQGFINSAIQRSNSLVADLGINIQNLAGSPINKFFIHYPRVGRSGKTIDTSMKLKTVQQLSLTNSVHYTGPSSSDQYTIKYYGISSPPSYNIANPIIQSTLLSGQESYPNSEINTSSGLSINNRTINYSDPNVAQDNFGQYAYFIETQNSLASVGNSSIIISNIVIDNPGQYGGRTYSDRSENTYISCGHFRPIPLGIIADPIETPEVFGGDIFVCLYDSLTYRKNWGNSTGYIRGIIHTVPLETDINIDLLPGDRANNTYTLDANNNEADIIESGNYFTVYSAEDNLRSYFPPPSTFFQVDKWINRFAASNVKINGELVDNWSVFPIGDVWDADGQYGEINGIINHDSKMFFWQDRAFGILQVNPRVFIGDLNNPDVDSQIQLGFGNKLQRHDYISNTSGTRHQGSILNTKSGLFWMDTNLKKLMNFQNTKDGSSMAPISDVKGLYAYLIKNFKHDLIDKACWDVNPNGLSGISAIYDVLRDKIYYTVHNGLVNGIQSSFTITYSNLTGTFVSFKSFVPKLYISDYTNVFTFDDIQTIYVNEKGNYNEFYGVKQPSTIKYIVNDSPNETKVFDNLEIITQSVNENNPNINNNDDTWKKIRVTNDYQNTDWIDLIVDNNIRRPERIWKLDIPRNRVLYTTSNSPDIMIDISATRKLFGERMRDKYINIELQYNNPNSNLLKTSLITTEFRQSPR